MKNAKLYLSIVLISSLFLGCQFMRRFVKSGDKVLPGFSMLPNPNELDKPGAIFYIDNDKVIHPLGVLDLEILTGDMVGGSLKGTRETSVGFLTKFIGIEKLELSGEINLEKNVEFSVEFKDAKQDRIQLLNAQEKISEAIKSMSAFDGLDLGDKKMYLNNRSNKGKRN